MNHQGTVKHGQWTEFMVVPTVVWGGSISIPAAVGTSDPVTHGGGHTIRRHGNRGQSGKRFQRICIIVTVTTDDDVGLYLHGRVTVGGETMIIVSFFVATATATAAAATAAAIANKRRNGKVFREAKRIRFLAATVARIRMRRNRRRIHRHILRRNGNFVRQPSQCW